MILLGALSLDWVHSHNKKFFRHLTKSSLHAAETLPLYHHCITLARQYLSCAPYLFPLVFAVLVVLIPTSCSHSSLRLLIIAPPSLTYMPHVIRTMITTHTTSSWRSPSIP
jgi:hypothetical protein